jgi:hypothetical protein
MSRGADEGRVIETDTGFGGHRVWLDAARNAGDYQPAFVKKFTSSRMRSTKPTSFAFISAGESFCFPNRWVRFATRDVASLR